MIFIIFITYFYFLIPKFYLHNSFFDFQFLLNNMIPRNFYFQLNYSNQKFSYHFLLIFPSKFCSKMKKFEKEK